MSPKPDLSFIPPMEARLAEHLPDGEGWQFEPKWDGFRAIAVARGGEVALWSKSGKTLGRYFPEVLAMLSSSLPDGTVLDGELVISIHGAASFDALQARLHPAESRVRKLAAATPALLVVFDVLEDTGLDLRPRPLLERRDHLEKLLKRLGRQPGLRLSPVAHDAAEAQGWLNQTTTELDGVVAKRFDEPYRSGERAMVKVKRIRSADCVVGGFRYGTGSKQVGSLLLGLYDAAGLLHHVGFTSGIANADKPELTRCLEALAGGSGFTGDAPGGPSRWSTDRSAEWVALAPELVIEVFYDQVTGRRFRHGTRLHRWRPDKAPRQCTFEQIAEPADPDAVIGEIVGHRE